MKTSKEIFTEQGHVLVKGLIAKDLAQFLYRYIMLTTKIMQFDGGSGGDIQVPDALSAMSGDAPFEVLQLDIHKRMEECTGLELIPTYTFRRLYKNGNVLNKHKDRPSCEISVTIKLSDSGGYNWPIWMVDTSYELEDGDAVIYRGCDLEHWRETCGGPDSYIMGQVFAHYVDKNGPFTEYAYDKNQIRANVFESLKNGFLG